MPKVAKPWRRRRDVFRMELGLGRIRAGPLGVRRRYAADKKKIGALGPDKAMAPSLASRSVRETP